MTNQTNHHAFETLCQLCSPNSKKEDITLSTVDWRLVYQQAIRHRVVPAMYNRMKQLNIDAIREVQDHITADVKTNTLKGLRQSAELVHITKLFNTQKISFVAFKGLAFLKLLGLEIGQRHHGDIDLLLADYKDLKKADALLKANQYNPLHSSLEYISNEQQYRHFLRSKKDIEYFNDQTQTRLELHFKLYDNDLLLKTNPQTIYKRRETVQIGDTQVPVMNQEDHQLYLLIHGSLSKWFRLKWLLDIPAVSNNGQKYLGKNFYHQTTQLGLEHIITQGLWLAHTQLKMPISDAFIESYQQSQLTQKIVEFASHMQLKELDYDAKVNVLNHIRMTMRETFFYQLTLKEEWGYKQQQIVNLSINCHDWKVIKLPKYLFWMYIPLRPFLWMYRQITD